MPALDQVRRETPNAAPPHFATAPQAAASRRRVRTRRQAIAEDDMTRLAAWGWAIIVAFFGLLGSWSLIAPLNGAVVATGVVKVDGNRKSVQHRDGGTVKQVKTREGDTVVAGQVLLVLDDTHVRAEFDILEEQYLDLAASQARMQAELAGHSTIEFPPALLAQAEGHKAILDGQRQQFALRRTALEGQRRIVTEKIAQLEAQIAGTEAQVSGNRSQRDSIQKEAASLSPLVEKGIVARPRLLQLERSAAAFEGQVGELTSAIARTRQAIAEQKQLAAQLDRERAAETAKELQATDARLAELQPRLTSARRKLANMDLRAPYAGRVVGLSVFSTGAVVSPGEKVLDIVPDRELMVVEAQIGVEDIADVHPGGRAEVRLLAYKQRTTPSLIGEVVQVSADRLVDNRNGTPYYAAQIRLADDSLAAAPGIKLYPGMPASIMIPTVERSAFDYLVGPLITSFETSFRQK